MDYGDYARNSSSKNYFSVTFENSLNEEKAKDKGKDKIKEEASVLLGKQPAESLPKPLAGRITIQDKSLDNLTTKQFQKLVKSTTTTEDLLMLNNYAQTTERKKMLLAQVKKIKSREAKAVKKETKVLENENKLIERHLNIADNEFEVLNAQAARFEKLAQTHSDKTLFLLSDKGKLEQAKTPKTYEEIISLKEKFKNKEVAYINLETKNVIVHEEMSKLFDEETFKIILDDGSKVKINSLKVEYLTSEEYGDFAEAFISEIEVSFQQSLAPGTEYKVPEFKKEKQPESTQGAPKSHQSEQPEKAERAAKETGVSRRGSVVTPLVDKRKAAETSRKKDQEAYELKISILAYELKKYETLKQTIKDKIKKGESIDYEINRFQEGLPILRLSIQEIKAEIIGKDNSKINSKIIRLEGKFKEIEDVLKDFEKLSKP